MVWKKFDFELAMEEVEMQQEMPLALNSPEMPWALLQLVMAKVLDEIEEYGECGVEEYVAVEYAECVVVEERGLKLN